MIYTVTITSQGQFTIPAEIRKNFFNGHRKAILDLIDNRIELRPAKDIFDLEGILKTKKKIPFSKIRKDFSKYLAKRSV